MKNAITIILAVVASLLLLRICSGPSVVVKEVTRSDTVTVVKVDTVVIEKPIPVRVVEKEPVYIPVSVPEDTAFKSGDTVQIPVPISQYQYRDSLYSLDVSGFNVSVDRMEVYPRTIYRTINTVTERKVTDRKRFGIGIQAGYGINLGTGKLTPYIGVGVQYSVWRW